MYFCLELRDAIYFNQLIMLLQYRKEWPLHTVTVYSFILFSVSWEKWLQCIKVQNQNCIIHIVWLLKLHECHSKIFLLKISMPCICYGILDFTLPCKNLTLLTTPIIHCTLTMKITYNKLIAKCYHSHFCYRKLNYCFWYDTLQ